MSVGASQDGEDTSTRSIHAEGGDGSDDVEMSQDSKIVQYRDLNLQSVTRFKDCPVEGPEFAKLQTPCVVEARSYRCRAW